MIDAEPVLGLSLSESAWPSSCIAVNLAHLATEETRCGLSMICWASTVMAKVRFAREPPYWYRPIVPEGSAPSWSDLELEPVVVEMSVPVCEYVEFHAEMPDCTYPRHVEFIVPANRTVKTLVPEPALR